MLTTAYLTLPFKIDSTAACALAALLLLLSISAAITLSSLREARLFGLLIGCMAFGCFLGLLNIYQRQLENFAPGLPPECISWVEGRLDQDAVPLAGGKSGFVVDVRSVGDDSGRIASANGVVRIFSEQESELYWGSAVKAGISGLAKRAGGWSAFLSEPVILGEWKSGFLRRRARLAAKIRTRIKGETGADSSFLLALILGVKEDPADPVMVRFRRAGASHLLALSGMHLAIIAGFLLMLLKPWLGRKRAFFLSLPLIAGYVCIVGLRPSLLRAGLMYFLWGVTRGTERSADSLSLLAVACIVITAADPAAVTELSFQLSFLAILGILIIGKRCAVGLAGFLPRWLAT
ncbi:MAG: ComEC/Rec2 family competence protein, partial [Spirochaetales bacterium]|nr:ComEC/Rec2 family competence protein [Spirochaetales bacterium]